MNDDEIAEDRLLRAALASLGRVIPETDAEVDQMRTVLANERYPDVSDDGEDRKLIARALASDAKVVSFEPVLECDTAPGLARAARMGEGTIPPEMEAKMRRNRSKDESAEE